MAIQRAVVSCCLEPALHHIHTHSHIHIHYEAFLIIIFYMNGKHPHGMLLSLYQKMVDSRAY